MPNPAFIQIDRVQKAFGAVQAVRDVSLHIAEGEIICLLGGSGSGKSTLLRMLAGFESPTGGRILIDGADTAGTPPEQLPVNMMFQSYALFPHMTVYNNIAYGLRREGVPKSEIGPRVQEGLQLVKMSDYASRKPAQLSGGQRQRVALARALVKRPKVLLLDEPLAALDKKLREETQQELLTIQRALGLTFIVVTHDQEEAMHLANRVGVMDEGRLIQVGTPDEIYEHPSNLFVANFVGRLNTFDALVLPPEGGIARVQMAGDIVIAAADASQFGARTPVTAAIRPESVQIKAAGSDDSLPGRIEFVGFLGRQITYTIALPGGLEVQVDTQNTRESGPRPKVGDTVGVHLPPRDMKLFARTSA
ncbi:ABC transporter ATP-binding protein [Yoonia sp.]|uniref:ABC transporter ATP-binding protein n=1 Tax=Yoonia sp. TaxID=2212373 RepID=UPI002FD9A088